MAKFLNPDRPLIVSMIGAKTTDEYISIINSSIEQGAEAFCFLAAGNDPAHKSKENIKQIIDATGGRGVYFTNYHRDNSQPELSDEFLAEQLLDAIDCGANLIDVCGDLFCRCTDELTRDAAAVKKQKDFISEIHNRGAEVLMSTHIFEYRSPETILEIALNQQERGADIAKIVTSINSQRELDDAFRTNYLLKEKLNIPFLYLCNGSYNRYHRIMGPLHGSCFYLCVDNNRPSGVQPTIAEAKMMLEKVALYKEKEN